MHKSYPIQVWFLDEDMQKSASYLTNKLLNKSILGCYQALLSARFYFIGIRNQKAFKWHFDKARKAETMEKFFPAWPLKMRPSFMQYGSRLSKWTRKCDEHVRFIKAYMSELTAEYEYRFGREHGLHKFLVWLDLDAPKLAIPEGHLTKITLEWKSINPRYRSKDIIAAYRTQYKHYLYNDGVKITDFTKRDMPEFLTMKEDNKWMD